MWRTPAAAAVRIVAFVAVSVATFEFAIHHDLEGLVAAYFFLHFPAWVFHLPVSLAVGLVFGGLETSLPAFIFFPLPLAWLQAAQLELVWQVFKRVRHGMRTTVTT